MMPPPKYAPIKKRRSRRATDFVPKTSSQPCSPMSLKTSSRRPASISSLATNSLPPPSHRYRHHQQNDSDSDGACGFDAAWRGGN